MMFLEGYIGAPPTLTVVSADAGTTVTLDTSAKAASAVAASKLRRIDMVMLLRSGVGWKAALPPVERRSRPRPPKFVADQSHFVVGPSYGSFGPRFRGVRNLTGS